jgi:hypothetical protein
MGAESAALKARVEEIKALALELVDKLYCFGHCNYGEATDYRRKIERKGGEEE